jgi:hypothetical protein
VKVFLSWSGTRSHKVALVFRDWLPSVIQEIVPYVSSEDIDKGARWSTDIAKELSDSTFGILCVTRENTNAPWLTFEAGALSKTMDKSFVSPFLFDIKRSEVDGPILQFQSTIFEKEDLKKLVVTLNRACDKDGLSVERLSKAFDVWYPTLETELSKLRDIEPDAHEIEDGQELQTPKVQEILEEILELSRINQKLIRNPDGSLGSNLEEMANMLRSLLDRINRPDDPFSPRRMRKFHPMMLDELMHMSLAEGNGFIGAQMALGLVRSQMPWVYDAGIETINILRSRRGIEEKHEALNQFQRVMEFSFEHPMTREFFGGNKEMHFMYRRLPDMLMDAFQRNQKG